MIITSGARRRVFTRAGSYALRVAYVGGTAIPFDGTAAYYDGYVASVRKMAKAAADFGATALLSNHTEFDNGYYKAHTAAGRKAGEANPFDVGRGETDGAGGAGAAFTATGAGESQTIREPEWGFVVHRFTKGTTLRHDRERQAERL